MANRAMAALLFLPRPRHAYRVVSCVRRALVSRSNCSVGAEGIGEMRQVGRLLRSVPSRIGRRLALIVAIAAESLPSAGA